MPKLFSTPSLVESPFIICKIGDYTFGRPDKHNVGNILKLTCPEYMKSISITKYNGEVNTYTVDLVYPISPGSDPNFIDYVISSVSDTREMTLSYGDWSSPSFIYKEEPTLITKVTSNVNFTNPQISYQITAVSNSLKLKSTTRTYAGRQHSKPSSIIRELLENKSNGLQEIFPGMKNWSVVLQNNLIDTDDQEVELHSLVDTDVMTYLSYLVESMIPIEQGNSLIGNSFYKLSVIDDNRNQMGGSYFTVKKISKLSVNKQYQSITNSVISEGAYEIDVGYPQDNLITNFNISQNDNWNILYLTNSYIEQNAYSYKIDQSGKMVREYAPTITRESSLKGLSSSDKSWWTKITEFPIQATIEFRGLVRPSTLMSAIKLNVMFHGRRHISSGYYNITKEEDRIDSNGYKTTLTLIRTAGDTTYTSTSAYDYKYANSIDENTSKYTNSPKYNSSVGNKISQLSNLSQMTNGLSDDYNVQWYSKE